MVELENVCKSSGDAGVGSGTKKPTEDTVELENILNSKIKKVRIELPHYSFSHSSSGESSHAFVGRKQIQKKLAKLIEATNDETGVYLVTGNRGVGKTSLVNKVINQTSLRDNSNFSKNLKYLLILLLSVAVTQFCLQRFGIDQYYLPIFEIIQCCLPTFEITQFCLQEFKINLSTIVFLSTFAIFFILLCHFNGYRHKISKQNINFLRKICNLFIPNINAAIKELFTLINPYNPYKTTQYILKIISIVNFMQTISVFISITPIKAFGFYLCFVFAFMFWQFIKCKLYEYCKKYEKEELLNKNLHEIEDDLQSKNKILKYIYPLIILLFSPVLESRLLCYSLILIAIILVTGIIVAFCCCAYFKKDIRLKCLIKIMLYETILIPIWKYIKNHRRLYLRINFGHKLKDEKDILRLITRTLSTEYNKYLHSFKRMLPWRVMAFGFLLLFAHLSSTIVEKQEFYMPIKESPLYRASSQVHLNDFIYSNDNRSFNKAETFLLALDTLVFEISKKVKKIPQFFLCKDEDSDTPINYLFWLSFFIMYLLCVLLFRCNWITHFFVTNRIIKQQLKRLNSDITYSTELEKSVNIMGGDIGTRIGTKTRKSRSVADAREIEKELQDILENVRRIPFFMCRPSFVIVFDELDKVEPGESKLENENQKTKASLFSIDATRERQTEILKILSNMKYFLSTAKAKFIFIAGREMHDIYLADVSERNNYIGSIFNAVIYVPSFLTDHADTTHSDMTLLTEEFVCRRLIPHDYPVESYNFKNYRDYLKEKIYNDANEETEQKIHKIIAVLQQFIIYLAHVSKGAPKKMTQLFELFIEICKIDKNEEDEFLVVQRYNNSRLFLTFNYYKQYMLGVIAYLITPIFNRLSLSEGNIKEHSDNDKLLVSSLRFIDFLFKFHKHPFSWKHLDISPEMLEVNRSLELKSVAVDLLNYLAQVHINKSNFSLSDYKFDNLISDEIFAVTKIDEVFSALFSFSLDETLSLKKHYQDMLERTQKEYINDKSSPRFIDAVSSLQVVLGDLHYYDDELEEAGVYYKNAVQELSNLKPKKEDMEGKEDKAMTLEQHYLYVRNMLRLGMIYENRKQYDFAYLTYGELCKRIIRERNITIKELSAGIALREDSDGIVFVKTSTIGNIKKEEKKYYDNVEVPVKSQGIAVDASIASPLPLYFKNISPNTNDMLSKKMTYEGLKMLYLPFIAKLQILEKSHLGGITRNHLEQLEKEFKFLTFVIDHEEANLLEAEFFSRVADILYYKNSDLKSKKKKNRKEDNNEDKNREEDKSKSSDDSKDTKNDSCTACYYYHKALSILLDLDDSDKIENKDKNTITKLLYASVERLNANYNMKYCTILARILSDWGNVFFSCDYKHTKYEQDGHKCYICDAKDCNTGRTCDRASLGTILKKYIDYVESEEKNRQALLNAFNSGYNFSKMEIAFAMYAISLKAYTKSNLYKRSAYQIFKMLRLFKYHRIYEYTGEDYTKKLSQKAIRSLLNANEDLNTFEINKRKKDFDKHTIEKKIPLPNILVDSEINRIKVLVKDLELKSNKTAEKLKKYYGLYITSPYGINYSIPARIYQLRLKATVNYEAYQMLIDNKDNKKELEIGIGIKFILSEEYCSDNIKAIFNVGKEKRIYILEKLIAETIFCFKEIIRLSKIIGETYLFNHLFMGSIHGKLSFWIRLYEIWRNLYEEEYKSKFSSQIDKYFKKYLGEEWEEQLSGYYENQQALSHYYKCLETHNEGRAYHNMIDNMCYLKDDYNDRSDHFNIAEERHNILNGEIGKKIEKLKKLYENSKLYDVDNYLYKEDNY